MTMTPCYQNIDSAILTTIDCGNILVAHLEGLIFQDFITSLDVYNTNGILSIKHVIKSMRNGCEIISYDKDEKESLRYILKFADESLTHDSV